MNLARLKTYAPAARNALITAVTRRAGTLGIQAGRVEAVTESGDVALIGGHPFPRSIVPLRKQLLDLIQRDGFDHTMEAMAYTWFNRLVALRFMELHDGYLDHGYRVLSHPQGANLPEILQHAEHVTFSSLDRDEVIRLKLDGNRDEELYRLLLLAQCNELNRILPSCFSRLDDATILLLPDNLLHSDSVIRQLVSGSDEEDWQQVEVLGWLYQFYISEKKDAVMARKSAVPTDDIPAVTQLFTPHWIVRYLVENSLGRLWLLNRPNSRLRDHMPYYIEGEQETDFLKITKPEDIKLVDPAVGSGHMLTYAFDLLTLIYEEEGYAANDIPGLILKHNLHGLDLCPRAAQLAELALVFKAREKSRRFFSPGNLVRPNIIELQDVRFADGELREYFHAFGAQPSAISQNLVALLHQFEEAKNFGSLIQPCLSEVEIQSARLHIQNSKSNIQNSADLMVGATHLKVLRVLEQAEALTQRYHVVVANPPYMGAGQMNPSLKKFIESQWNSGKADSYASFMLRNVELVKENGVVAMITIPNWMFLTTFEPLRDRVLQTARISSLIQCGRGVWGADFGSCAFVLQASSKPEGRGTFRRLFQRPGEVQTNGDIEANFFNTIEYPVHYAGSNEFRSIPGIPIAYWLSARFCATFRLGNPIGGAAKKGLSCSGTELFYRYFWEVEPKKMSAASGKKWFPITKGGNFRKWYGNNEYVINWENDGFAVKGRVDGSGKVLSAVRNETFYFREGASWNDVSIGTICCRYTPSGAIPTDSGPMLYSEDRLLLLLALMNSCVAKKYAEVLCPTVHFGVGQIASFPVIEVPGVSDESVTAIVDLARADWDNFETSWDFRVQPLLRQRLKGATLEESWRNWEAHCTAAIRRMQELETENNRLFIAAYGLEGELQPAVPEEQITLARADTRKDMAAFLSYAVGCMMGRYSLDAEGLVLANAGDTVAEYMRILGERGNLAAVHGKDWMLCEEGLSFEPDADGIIPMLDGEWFEDDLVARTKEFLRATFGEATLTENLRFIEQSLGRELRDYFLTDFYKDHLQTYKNRPIYWLFSSGKQKAFQCLVYLHRYTPATLARIRTEYVIPLQGKLSARISRIGGDPDKEGEGGEIAATTSSVERKKLQTDLDKAKKQMVELLAFDAQLRTYTNDPITLDLDDGVKTNYAKFGPLVAESKKVCGTKDD